MSSNETQLAKSRAAHLLLGHIPMRQKFGIILLGIFGVLVLAIPIGRIFYGDFLIKPGREMFEWLGIKPDFGWLLIFLVCVVIIYLLRRKDKSDKI